MTTQKRLSITKDMITKFKELWQSKGAKELAEELGISQQQVSYIAHEVRRAGFDLPKKRIPGQLRTLISEVFSQ